MNIFSIDWADFFNRLEKWTELDLELRRCYLEMISPNPVFAGDLESITNQKKLIEEGFLKDGVEKSKAEPAKGSEEFAVVMEYMYNNPLLDLNDMDVYDNYFTTNFTPEEKVSFIQNTGEDFLFGEYVIDSVMSYDYVMRFLDEKNPAQWERNEYNIGAGKRYFKSKKTFNGLKYLINEIIERDMPIFMHELSEWAKKNAVGKIEDIVPAGIRYGLLFASIDHHNLLPKICIYPGALARFNRPAPQVPKTVESINSFSMPFLLHDLCLILQHCAIEPVRVKKNDYSLYKKSEEAIINRLYSFPVEIEQRLNITKVARVYDALQFAVSMKLIKHGSLPGRKYGIFITKKGKKWLQSTEDVRFECFVDSLKESYAMAGGDRPLGNLDYGLSFYSQGSIDVFSEMRRIYSDHRYEDFVLCHEFLIYHSQADNPLITTASNQLNQKQYARIYEMSDEKAEELWWRVLEIWQLQLLFPSGCIEIGFVENGEPAFRLTDIGRYFFGFEETINLSQPKVGQARILPNFEIVFLEPSPHAEAQLSAFCERIGEGVGNVFRINSDSIKQCIATGWTKERILSSLESVSEKGIPEIVKHEINEWASQVKKATVKTVMLIHCQDEVAMAALEAELCKHAEKVNETTLAVSDMKKKKQIMDLIRKKGIFIDSD